jgi:hypothetical protein
VNRMNRMDGSGSFMKVTIVDSLAPARSGFAGFWLRPDSFRRVPRSSSPLISVVEGRGGWSIGDLKQIFHKLCQPWRAEEVQSPSAVGAPWRDKKRKGQTWEPGRWTCLLLLMPRGSRGKHWDCYTRDAGAATPSETNCGSITDSRAGEVDQFKPKKIFRCSTNG